MFEDAVMARHVAPEYELIITCPSDLLEESVVYQDIFQKGFKRGVQQAGRAIAQRQLERRFGKLAPGVRRQIEQLAVEQLEALCAALLDFQSKADLIRWLKQHAPTR